MKIGIGVILAISILLMANVALAATDNSDKIDIPKDWHGKKKIVIPRGELTQVVFIKYVIIDVGDPDKDGARDGYELSGLKWNMGKYLNGVPYIINPSAAVKNYRLTQSSVVAAVKNSLEAWDSEVNVNLYGNYPKINTGARASTSWPDYKNVITWARISNSGVVAMANMWYYTATGELVDADIIFNTYYRWGIDSDGEGASYTLSNAMDIRNVCTHEAGHWTGLNDLYDSAYSAMTMYGYTSYGEVVRRSLEQGDIYGAQAVYRA